MTIVNGGSDGTRTRSLLRDRGRRSNQLKYAPRYGARVAPRSGFGAVRNKLLDHNWTKLFGDSCTTFLITVMFHSKCSVFNV